LTIGKFNLYEINKYFITFKQQAIARKKCAFALLISNYGNALKGLVAFNGE